MSFPGLCAILILRARGIDRRYFISHKNATLPSVRFLLSSKNRVSLKRKKNTAGVFICGMESKVKSLGAYVMQCHVFLKEYICSQEAQSYTQWNLLHDPLNSRGKSSCWLCNPYATIKIKRGLCPRYKISFKWIKDTWMGQMENEVFNKLWGVGGKHLVWKTVLKNILEVSYMQLLHSPDCGSSLV